MTTKIISHGDVDYEKILLGLISRSSDPFLTSNQLRIARKYLANTYGEDNVIAEAVHVGICIEQTIDGALKLSNTNLAYGNLYTYVLISGICVPYFDWVYEDVFVTEDYTYRFDSLTATGTKKLTSPLSPPVDMHVVTDTHFDPLPTSGAIDYAKRMVEDLRARGYPACDREHIDKMMSQPRH